jgi:hypothetical protein
VIIAMFKNGMGGGWLAAGAGADELAQDCMLPARLLVAVSVKNSTHSVDTPFI